MRRDRLMMAASFAVMVGALPVAAGAQEVSVTHQDTTAIAQTVATIPLSIEREETHAIASNAPASISRDALRAGVRAPVTTAVAGPSIARSNAGLGQARAMMIVGGAAVVLGAIIGDTPGTLIMVGGTVVGLVGLYQYLQ